MKKKLVPHWQALGSLILLAGASIAAPAWALERQPRDLAREIFRPQISVPKPDPGISVKVATPDEGIAGEIREADLSLIFKSRQTGGSLTSTISGADGTVLYEYREFEGQTIRFRGGDGTRVTLAKTPELRVKGLLYGPPTPERAGALRSLALSREGALIRHLGLALYRSAPSPGLVAERRGLELAAQALWPDFPQERPVPAVLTMDYEIGPQGYVVLTQPDELVLATNHVSPHSPAEKHDDNQVNGCFGRCGEGCTGGFGPIQIYASHWTDTYGTAIPAHQEVHCVTGEDWIYSFYQVPTTHSVTGLWTPGCQLHDNCCRLNPLLCLTVCMGVAGITGVDLLADPQKEIRTWTYTDYQWSITSYNAGYSGCTCPGMSPYLDDYECIE